jgi:Ca2+-binding RTX toxin-like protein
MAILTVGPASTFPTIAAAMAAAAASDTIQLESGYSNETATVTHPGMTISGDATSTGIILQLSTGITTFFLAGTAPINVLDNAADGNGINGNDGDNVITVTGGADAVSGGLGTDRLVVDYRLTSGAVTGNSTTNVADAGGLGIVTINGGFEHFTILTGSGADTITTGAGDDIINTGEGASTVTAGQGANSITGGSGADTVTALDGGNFIDGGGGDNTLTSGGGNDVITGGLGVDTIVAGGGNDVITVRSGGDTVDSGADNDRLVVDYSSSVTAVNGGVTGGTLAGGYDGTFADVAGTSSVVFHGTENFTVTTGSGNDVIATGSGDDVLDGGRGGDDLNGGGGSDTLLIGLGDDTLDGGADSDAAIFSAARANYQVIDLGDGVIQTIDLRTGSPDGTDTLVNMEGFVFTDGAFDATTILNVAPTLGGDLAIAVATGGMVIVTAADLTATDADSTNAELVYTVTGTLHGAVLLAGSAATSFTEADILANAVSFQHDGSASNGSFTVSLTDGAAAPQVATVIAAAGNATPSATNDALSAMAEDSGQRTILGSALTGNDSAGPSSESGQTLTVTGVSNVIGGSTIVSGGSVLFTPTANFNGAASFDYTVTDDGTTNGVADPLTATATASFTVTESNEAPSATNDALSATAEDSGQRTILGSSLTGNDSAGSSSESSQTLTVTGVSNVSGGSAIVSGGNVLFTPMANFSGAASFDYTVTDDGTTSGAPAPLTATASASFTVTEVNDTPSATNDALSAVAENSGQCTILGSALTGNDSAGPLSESGQTLTVTAVSNVIGGSASVSGGNVLFTPTANFNGVASFGYTVTDDGTTNGVSAPLTSTASASFNVNAVSDAPMFTGLDNNPSFIENGATVVLDSNAAVSDADLGPTDPIPGATLTLARAGGGNPDDLFSSGRFDESQVISLISSLVVGMYTLADGTLTVTFNEDAVFADVTDLVRSLTYQNASDSPPASVQIGYQFDNGEIATGSITVGITAVNDPPAIGGVAPASYQPGSAGVVLSPGIALTDFDSAALIGATASLNAHDPTDLLSVNVGSSGIAASYDPTSGVLTLTGSASLDAYRQVLATVTYSSSATDPTASGATRTISWQVNDGSPSTPVDSSLDFFPVIDLDQSAAGTGFATTFTDGGMGVAIADTDAHIIATASSITSATVVLTNALAGDSLSAPGAALPFTINNSVPGRITLTFTSSGGDFEAALQRVVFSSAGANVNPTTRDVTVVIQDNNNTSNTAHTTISIRAVNNAPVITSNGGGDNATLSMGENLIAVTTMIAVDADGPSTAYSITGGADAASFQINVSTGALSFITAPNFEAPSDADHNNSFHVQVRASDGSLFDDQVITIDLLDQNDAAGNDFNGDARSDILWQTNGGQLAIWEMNGAQIDFADYSRMGASNVGLPGSDWHIVDTGDFDNDGKSDLLWRTDSGALAIWEMKSTQIKAADYIRSGSTSIGAPGPDWHLLGTADFDGDSKSDLLWQIDSGALAIWEMDGTQIKAADYIKMDSAIVGVPGRDWHIVGTGDFDGDSKSDLLWRTDSGALAIWEMNGTQIKAADYIKTGSSNIGAPGSDWHIVDTGDFDHDGKSDLLWRTDSGALAIWEMDGTQIKAADYIKMGSANVGTPGLDWHIVGADDYDGNGTSDLLWRTDSGAHAVWEMNGSQIALADYTKIGSSNVAAPGSDWNIIQHHYDLI